jgi:hypothetical protein
MGIKTPTGSTQALQDLTSRVKHIEASLAVHDLAHSGSVSAPYQAYTKPVPEAQAPSETKLDYGFDPNAEVRCDNYMPFITKKSRLEFHNGISFASLVKMDSHLRIVWVSLWKNLEKAFQSRTNVETVARMLPASCTKGVHELMALGKQKSEERNEIKASIKAVKTLDELILANLPNNSVLFRLCLRFFKKVYPYMPFLNESFFTELDQLLGTSFSTSKPASLNIKSKHDYATFGLLFLIMRLGYLSIEEREFLTSPELKDMKDLSITKSYLEIAFKCLEEFKFLKKPYSLRVLQLLLFLKLCYIFCPESDDTSNSTGTKPMIGLLYSTAQSLGLHVDPSRLVDMAEKSNINGQMWRRIWHKILELDAAQAVMTGTQPLCYDEDSYTTELPMDHSDDPIEREIDDDFRFLDEKTKLYRKISIACFKLKRSPNALEFSRYIQELDTFICVHFGSLKQVLNDSSLSSIGKSKKVGYLFELNSMLLSLNILILHHFEQISNTKKVYEIFDKCLTMTMKILNSSLNLFYNFRLYFDPGVPFLRPSAYIAVTKAFLFMASILTKLSQCKKLVPKTQMSRWVLMNDFHKLICSSMRSFLRLGRGISDGFFRSQKVMFAARLIFEMLKDPEFDFDESAKHIISAIPQHVPGPSSGRKAVFLFQEINAKDIPKENFLMNFADTELSYLKSKLQTEPFEVLRPLISTEEPFEVPKSVNPSGTGNGQFYDPVDGFTKSNTPNVDVPVTPHGLSPFSYIGLFGDDNDKGSNTDEPIKSLTSEEYASLYGLFEDYGIMDFDVGT